MLRNIKQMVLNFVGKVRASICKIRLARSGVNYISGFVASEAVLETNGGGVINLGENVALHRGAVLMTYGGRIDIGANVGINPYTVIYGMGEGTRIGNDVMIAAHCVIVPANHVFSSTKVPINQQGVHSKGIVIEDDVWLGAGVRVLDGTTIGQGSVIGAGSVVMGSIPPYSVAVGVPARIIRSRNDIA